ncbi:flagellar hook-associated protein 2 [Viridibacillus sp. NPDC093762]|uniref:flagellar hook-associated protein 2 n=1 Tax=Viridibacillus sp. NPDC093762 TaxID=3390720 RepID=UPI003CFD42FF
MRISGLASGMDTDKIISDLMKAQRVPLDKITQKKQYTQWQLDDYRTVNRKLNDFSNNIFDTILKPSTFLAKKVNISSPDAVSIKGINATTDFSGTIAISQLASQASMQSKDSIGKGFDTKKTMNDLGFTGTGSITINAIAEDGTLKAGKEITFDPSEDSLETVLKKINTESGVTAFYDSFSGKIALTAKNSGDIGGKDNAEIEVSGDLATFFKLDSDNVVAESNKNGKLGTNAEFTFNGLETQRNSNSFQINGFEISLKQVTSIPVSFSSSPDTDTVVDAVKKFVDDYNKLIEELNTKVREKKYRDFQPLSDEQKKDMKEKDIELWEEKAKSGTLKNEPILTSMLQQMRSALGSTITGTAGKISLSDIGIKTTKDYSANGKLEIDEKKLREAINADPNKVYEVFAKPGTTASDTGVVTKMRAVITESRKKLTEKAGGSGSVNTSFTIGRQLKGYDDQISKFEVRLKQIETRYYKQFSAMETAIQRANSQSAQLMNAFGGGQ